MGTWYFAYGSDISTKRMRKEIGSWSDARRASLKGYDVGFYAYSSQWGCGILDLVEREGGSVAGVAFLLDEKSTESLDRYEGVPTVARRLHVTVDVEGVGSVEAYTYTHVSKRKFVKPAKHYLDSVVSGMREWGYDDLVGELLRRAEGAST